MSCRLVSSWLGIPVSCRLVFSWLGIPVSCRLVFSWLGIPVSCRLVFSWLRVYSKLLVVACGSLRSSDWYVCLSVGVPFLVMKY